MSSLWKTVALVTLLAPACARAAGPPREGLEWSVVVSPQETLPGLAVKVRVTGVNRIEKELPCRYEHLGGALSVSLADPSGRSTRTYGGRHEHTISLDPPRLQPGERIVEEYWLFCDDPRGKNRHFPGPGRYLVHVVIDEDFLHARNTTPQIGRRTNKRLSPVGIHVRSPLGRDLEASRIFSELASAKWWAGRPQGYGSVPADRIETLTNLADEYGDTTYGKYARFRLATHFGYGGYQKDPCPPGQIEAVRKAKDILERLEADSPPENLKTDIWLDLADYSLGLGERDRARAWLERVEVDTLGWYRRNDLYDNLTKRLAKENGTEAGE